MLPVDYELNIDVLHFGAKEYRRKGPYLHASTVQCDHTMIMNGCRGSKASCKGCSVIITRRLPVLVRWVVGTVLTVYHTWWDTK